MRSDSIGIHVACLCKCPKVCIGDVESTSTCLYSTRFHLFGVITNLWMSILCVKPLNFLWHKRECLLGDCLDCGIQIKICFQELFSRHLIKWKNIGYEMVGQIEESKDRMVPTMKYSETTFVDYVKYL